MNNDSYCEERCSYEGMKKGHMEVHVQIIGLEFVTRQYTMNYKFHVINYLLSLRLYQLA